MIMQSKKQDICLTLNMKAPGSFETSDTTYLTAESCIPEDTNLHCNSTCANWRGYAGWMVGWGTALQAGRSRVWFPLE